MRTVIFSAHLDDAVLSATSQLTRPGAHLVTVFAGGPPAGLDRTWWDGITRADTSAERHRERLAEDDRATRLLGCTAQRLSEPEYQYRAEAADIGSLSRLLQVLMQAAGEVWLPAGIGGHPDHVAVREAGLSATRTLSRSPSVFLYADLPYAILYGWPSWVTGEPNPPFLDPDFWLDHELTTARRDAVLMDSRFLELEPDLREAKRAAVLCYETQLAALEITPLHAHRWNNLLRYELAWQARAIGDGRDAQEVRS